MSRFRDVYLPDEIMGYPTRAIPRFSNTLVEVASGDESALMHWAQPKQTFRLPEAVRCHDHWEDVRDHFYIMGATAYLFPFRDPLDFASVRLEGANVPPTISGDDQVLGVGDGGTSTFQLIKTYTRGAYSMVRTIRLPVVSSVILFVDGEPPSELASPLTYEVEREGGRVTFSGNVPDGLQVTAGYYFDVPVRFESDDALEAIIKAFTLTGKADLTLVERSLC